MARAGLSTLRKGVKFHEKWGEFTARDVRHAIFLICAARVGADRRSGLWRSLMGIGKSDSLEEVAKKVEQMVEIVNDHQVIIHTKMVAPELVDRLSAKSDLVMESKARWDAGGKELYDQKVVGTGPFEFVERKVGSYVLYKRVENHWRQTPEVQRTRVPLGARRGDPAGDADCWRGAYLRYRPRLAEGRRRQGYEDYLRAS